MNDRERAEKIRDSIPENGLFHEKSWRVSPDAFAISPEFATRLDQLGFQLVKFLRACNTLYFASVRGRQPAWIASLLDRGKPDDLVEIARDPSTHDQLPPVIRPDLILTESGFVLSEIDSVPGGIGLTGWLAGAYSETGADVLGGPDGMIDGFASILPGGDILVSAEAATYRPEMEWLAERLNAKFGAAGPGPRWRVLDAEAPHDWQPAAYRFFELFDLSNIAAAGALIGAIRRRQTALTPPLKPHLEEKIWFALFWLKPLEDFWIRELGRRTFDALRRVIPYSWIVDPAPLPPHAVLPRLEAHSWEDVMQRSQSDRELVLKISGFNEIAWGGRGVTVGSDISSRDWRAALEHALESFTTHPYLLQQFHKGRLVEHAWLDPGKNQMTTMKGRVRLCPYYFPTASRIKCAGALATICPADKKLLHGMTDAILVPAAIDPGLESR